MFTNEIESVWTPAGECDERAEGTLRAEFGKIAEQVGPDVWEDMAYAFALPFEADMRKNDPNNPALKLIDARRLKEERGFE